MSIPTRAWYHRDGGECFSPKVWKEADDPDRGICEKHERVVYYAESSTDPAESSEPPTLERVEQMSYMNALDFAVFTVNTWMHPDASEARDIIALEANSDAVIATLVDIRDVVAGWGGPAPAPLGYDAQVERFADAINLGIEVESDDPDLGADVKALTPVQVAWISSWLAGEGHRSAAAPTPAFTAAKARVLDEANTALAMVLDEITGGVCDSHTEPEPTCSVCHAVLLLEEMHS